MSEDGFATFISDDFPGFNSLNGSGFFDQVDWNPLSDSSNPANDDGFGEDCFEVVKAAGKSVGGSENQDSSAKNADNVYFFDSGSDDESDDSEADEENNHRDGVFGDFGSFDPFGVDNNEQEDDFFGAFAVGPEDGEVATSAPKPSRRRRGETSKKSSTATSSSSSGKERRKSAGPDGKKKVQNQHTAESERPRMSGSRRHSVRKLATHDGSSREIPSHRTHDDSSRGEPLSHRTRDDSSRGEPSSRRTHDDSSRGEPSSRRTRDDSSRGEPSSRRTRDDSSRGDPSSRRTHDGSIRGDPSSRRTHDGSSRDNTSSRPPQDGSNGDISSSSRRVSIKSDRDRTAKRSENLKKKGLDLGQKLDKQAVPPPESRLSERRRLGRHHRALSSSDLMAPQDDEKSVGAKSISSTASGMRHGGRSDRRRRATQGHELLARSLEHYAAPSSNTASALDFSAPNQTNNGGPFQKRRQRRSVKDTANTMTSMPITA